MSTRDKILDAAAQVIQTLGLARATTKEIARAAGFSEATLYKHFTSKEELFLRVVMERMPSFVELMKRLRTLVGTATVEANLTQVASAAIDFYCHIMPMGSSLFSSPDLLSSLRDELRERDAGPHKANQAVASYVAAEQALGRIQAGLDSEATAYLLLGSCFQRAYWSRFLGEPFEAEAMATFAANLVAALLKGLTPRV